MAEDKRVWQDYVSTPLAPQLVSVLERMVARSLQQRYETMAQVSLDFQSAQNSFVETSLDVSKKLMEKAKDVVPDFKNLLAKDRPSPLDWLLPGQGASSAALPAKVPTSKTAAAQTWRRIHRLAPDIGVTQALAISPNGQTLASGGADGAVRLWQLKTGRLWHTFPRRRFMGNGHGGAVTALAFHPDSRALYSASVDGSIKEWDCAECCLLNTLPTAGWTPMDLAVSQDGRRLVSPYSDGTIVIWDIQALRPVVKLTQHKEGVSAIALSPNSELLASIDESATMKLWKGQAAHFRLAKTITHDSASKGVSLRLVPI